MSAPAEVLAWLESAGVNLTLAGGDLVASPCAALTDGLRNLSRSNKPALVRILSDRLANGPEKTGQYHPNPPDPTAADHADTTAAVEKRAALGRFHGAEPRALAEAHAQSADGPDARDNPAARADALPELYRQWFAGIHEPRAVVTLTEAQAGQAVTAGVVTPETAWASVLVAIRSPLGAVGLMAIPREKYDGFDLMRALEAAPWVH